MRKYRLLTWLLIVSLFISLFSTGSLKTYAQQVEAVPKGYVTLSVEKFTLGQGYYREPMRIPFYEGDNGAAILTRELGKENIKHTGTVENYFYLSKVKDVTSSVYIPQYIVNQIELGGGQVESKRDPEWLGEFDYTSMSGWMYAVNNVFPNVGFSDYKPEDGDVIRTQFTVYGYGSDLGNTWGTGFINTANKDTLTAVIGQINSAPDKSVLLSDSAVRASYEQAYDILKNMESTQADVDLLLTELDNKLGWDHVKPVLSVQGISDQQAFTSKQISFQVSATDNVTLGISPEVQVNGAAIAGANGVFTVNLTEGYNSIVITASDASGNRVKQTFEVYYSVWSAAKDHLNKSLAYMYDTITNPTFGTLGGEWSVLSLARGNHPVPDAYYITYYKNVVSKVKELMAKNNGVLDKNRSTEHSRLILGLASFGLDPRDIAGYDITKALSDYDYILKQGINGPIFALIAMNTVNYEFPAVDDGKTQTTRDKLIDYILSKEVNQGAANVGGWALGGTKADVDMTAMALQALAPYYLKNDKVTSATDRALNWLSSVQNATGGFTSYGTVNSESIAQVITALSEIGFDPSSDQRFVKNGYSAVDALLAFAAPEGGFKHILSEKKANGMATDQGTYALVSFNRMMQSENPLYDMTDADKLALPENLDEIKMSLPSGDKPKVNVPPSGFDYSLPITEADSNKEITVQIPSNSNARITLNLPANSDLPMIEAVKGNVSAVIPKGAQIRNGDGSSLELLTTIDGTDVALKDQVSGIVAAGTKLDSIAKAITMGGTAGVTFDQFVTLTFTGMSGKHAAYIQNGTAQAIAKFASDEAGMQSGKNEFAYDSGNDLIVKTKHFTDFIAYNTSIVETPGGNGGTNPQPAKHITFSVDKATINKGYVLNPVSVELQPGDTVWSVFQRELGSRSIPYEHEWNEKYDSVYVQSIAGDGEFDHGTGSGWMYNVNGTYPNFGASKYVLADGDTVQWRYTTNLGVDLGQDPSEWENPDGNGTGNGSGNGTGTGSGTGSGATPNPNDKKPVTTVPSYLQKDFIFDITKQQLGTDNITLNIPDVKPKVILNVKEVQDRIPMITVNKGALSLVIDQGTRLIAGDSGIELFTALSAEDDSLQALIQKSLGADDLLEKISHAFVMGSSNRSYLFDKPLTLAIKGEKGQLAGFVEDGKFTPIVVYDSEEQGKQAVKGSEKFAYAFVNGDDLMIKTNHFTSYVTYSVSQSETGSAFDLAKKYADAGEISSWAYNAILEGTQRGFVEGSEGKMNPKAAVTRAEFTKLLVSVLGVGLSSNQTSGFADVSPDQWFYPYINTAHLAGFIDGYNDKFYPDDTITREQMAVISKRALGIQPAAAAATITDLDEISSWAKAHVQSIVAQELMTPGVDGRFLPGDTVTREMAAVVAMRAFAYHNDNGNRGGEQPEQPDAIKQAVKKQIEETAAYMQQSIPDPAVASIGGEWTVLSLARSGVQVPASYFEKYYANLEETLKAKSGKLHAVKYTEYSRVMLALTSIGKAVDDAAGYSMIDKLADFDTLIKQGINGPIFALIALDSKKFDIPIVSGVKTQTTREMLIDFILKRELSGGGWALGEKAEAADPDITAMAIQGLTPYYDTNEAVHAAIDRGISWLSQNQQADGGYASWQSANSESVAQVVVALTGLGIDPQSDPRFVKNGRSALEALLGFAVQGGGFYHIMPGGIDNGGAKPGDVDPMATDQAMYALVAYDRYLNGQNRLYDMTDV
ncbi:DUF4430 domain-containing protein [Paenibacillus contaminans]|uniref:S-layer protein n=1 Tax=Paenibacillus contaminans TaxID=450362 RepID=A0A329MUU7_9BACL|nr:DUF4430 domain-containing protein [Paenibacillus contaminans]RAV23452.1 S-layer protein [Paenibacillus contaminans]